MTGCAYGSARRGASDGAACRTVRGGQAHFRRIVGSCGTASRGARAVALDRSALDFGGCGWREACGALGSLLRGSTSAALTARSHHGCLPAKARLPPPPLFCRLHAARTINFGKHPEAACHAAVRLRSCMAGEHMEDGARGVLSFSSPTLPALSTGCPTREARSFCRPHAGPGDNRGV